MSRAQTLQAGLFANPSFTGSLLVEALRAVSRNRQRPITTTTLAAILTVLPLALVIGQYSGIQQPLATAVIAGLLMQYPRVLLDMPVLIRQTLTREKAGYESATALTKSYASFL